MYGNVGMALSSLGKNVGYITTYTTKIVIAVATGAHVIDHAHCHLTSTSIYTVIYIYKTYLCLTT